MRELLFKRRCRAYPRRVYKPLATGSGGNLTIHGTGPGNWLAGLDIDTFEGETIGERIARAAKSINADFLSPTATAVRLSHFLNEDAR